MSVYIAELNNPGRIPFVPRLYNVFENDHARWAEYYEVGILRGIGPDLKDKTVFDYSGDPAILLDILGVDSGNQERKANYINNTVAVNKASDIATLARLINDKPLELIAIDYASRLQAKFDRIAAKMRKNGIIVEW